MRRVIFNQKGGVGKTTITCNLAAISAAKGRKTLVIDLDPQANASQYLGCSAHGESHATIADYFQQTLLRRSERKPLKDFIVSSPFKNLDVLPAHPNLEVLQNMLSTRHKIYKLREGLDELDTLYHDILIDTPPAMNFYTRSALIAAERCVIPYDGSEFSGRSIQVLQESIEEIQEDHNPHLELEGILINDFVSQPQNAKRSYPSILNELRLPVFRNRLSCSIKLRESQRRSKPMIYFAPGHKISQEFQELYRELMSAPISSQQSSWASAAS